MGETFLMLALGGIKCLHDSSGAIGDVASLLGLESSKQASLAKWLESRRGPGRMEEILP